MAPKIIPIQHRNAIVNFDMQAFDNAIEGHGIVFDHFRAIRCPVGMIDIYDNRRVHDDHEGCSNGFIYKHIGKVIGIATGNGKSDNQQDIGILDSATLNVTLKRFYKDTGDTVYIAPYDRLYSSEQSVLVPNWERFASHASGVDRMQYPVERVETLIDSHGKEYGPEDFQIRNGTIFWGPNRPGVDPKTNKGTVCTAWYLYRPFWYVDRLNHEVRIARDAESTRRAPYALVAVREYVFKGSEQQDPEAKDPTSLRQAMAPESGSFGPR